MDEQQDPSLFQEQLKVVPGEDWWWAGWSVLSVAAIILNIIFITIVIKQRRNRDLRSLLTAALVALSVLDILDVLRIASSIFVNVHQFPEFRITYCSVGVFHTVGVALLLILSTIYLLFPCRDAPPLYYPASTCSGSLPQKLLVPAALLVAAGAAGTLFLLPELYHTLVDEKEMVPHSCLDYTRALHIADEKSGVFWSDLYQTCVLGLAVVIPLVLAPPAILVASVRACVKGQCCHVKHKQSAGELLCVLLLLVLYLGCQVVVVLPRLDAELGLDGYYPPTVPVLWELGLATARPLTYFLCNPGVWDGLKYLCSCSKRMRSSDSLKEEEMALAPVVERVSSI